MLSMIFWRFLMKLAPLPELQQMFPLGSGIG
jgi:hypothetical protein